MTSPFVPNPKRQINSGVPTGDPYYHTAKIVQVIKDDSISMEVIDDKEPIQEKIDAFKDKAGLKNILAMYARTGDKSLFEARSCINGIDATNIPTTDPDILAKSLPADLIEGLTTEQIKNLTIDDLVKYYSSKEENKDEKGDNTDGE